MKNETSLNYLYTALADELLAWYQYWACANISRGEGKSDADPEFAKHAEEEMGHADKVMLRIKELGGRPFPSPGAWLEHGNPWEEVATRDVVGLLAMTIDAEKNAVAFYKEAVEATRGKDETTHRLFRSILSDEEEHLYDLRELLEELEPGSAF